MDTQVDPITLRNAEDAAIMAQEAEIHRKIKITRQVEESVSLADVEARLQQVTSDRAECVRMLAQCDQELAELEALKVEVQKNL